MVPKIIARWTWTLSVLGWELLAFPLMSAAQQADKAAQPGGALPLTKVVMFNAGVGYFEHRGEIEGNANVELRFRVDDINDLLKSMILEDRGGGTISTVTYGSRDPITKTLKTFPVDLTGNPTLGAILDQVRGEHVQIDGAESFQGVLLGVEKRKKVGADRQVVETEVLNLLTDAGLRGVPLDSIGNIKLVNEKLDAELRQALQVLAMGHNTDKKSVTLNLQGVGRRPVRVAYIQEAPVWKTSYRLVLGDKEAPFLQGWAIVENTTETDWNNVTLTLVSGRPISYRMDLYEPLYAHRPLEELNLYASLRPQTYGQDLNEREAGEAVAAPAAPADGGFKLSGKGKARSFGRGSMGGGGGMAGGQPGAPLQAAAAPADGKNLRDEAHLALGYQFNAQSAEAGNVGELFQYVIGTPVTLARQKSAMLPIVNESVKGEKISIYDQSVQAKHPLNGLRLVNSTSLHLMQGPVTVFDGGVYAGDAKIDDLPPGAERLISYALDLKTEVAPELKSHPERLLSVRLSKGVMETSHKYSRTNRYTVKNSDTQPKTVLVEMPVDPNWKLIAPEKPLEKTRDKYRFAVKVEPGKSTILTVEEEQVVSQNVVLTNLDNNAVVIYLNQKEVSAAVKAALQEVVKRKQSLEKLATEKNDQQQQIATITAEQERIRKNMSQLDHNADLYKRYVQKFGAQEDSVEKIRSEIQRLTVEEFRQRQSLDDYWINLNI